VKLEAAAPFSDAASALADALGGFRNSVGNGIDLRLICRGNPDCRLTLSIDWFTQPFESVSKPKPFLQITQKLTYPTPSLIGMALVLYNPTLDAAELEITRYISCFARPLSSSLTVTVNGMQMHTASVLRRRSISPSRSASHALEWRSLGVDSFNISVPANSTVLLYAHIERSYIHWQRHQPDAHRGLDLPPLFVWHNASLIVVDSPIFLVPLPDFSMP
jgi:hypothetical protein